MSRQEPKSPQGEMTDVFTGESFHAESRNHYEENDGVPFAPPVDMVRPTVRQRIENLLNRGVDPLAHYVGTEGIEMDVPDDPDAPLTSSEQEYINVIAESLAEQAPLPDEGLPRPPQPEPATPVSASLGAPPGPSQGPGEGERPPPAAGPASTVPTR